MDFARLFACSALLLTGVLVVSARSFKNPDELTRFDGPTDVTLLLYTQNNPEIAEYIELSDDSTSRSFDPKNPTRFVIHGWISNAQNNLGFKDAYLATGDGYNVVLVDWSGIAASAEAFEGSILVGDYVGKVISHLIETRGLNPDTLSIVGHSMGAHVAAIAGNRAGGDQVVAEVVALDPAAGLYDTLPLENQLDITDAKFVQVIHTNAGATGIADPRGHADFYPNGGSKQAGCSVLAEFVGCSHNRVLDFYKESIISKDFIAAKCSSYEEYSQGACFTNEHIPMGEWTPLTVSGVYYLNTNGNAPYALGQTDL